MSALAFIGSYIWRFALYGFCFGALFGAVFGLVIGITDAYLNAWGGLWLGVFFGGGFGTVMGIGTGIVLGCIARVCFYPRRTPAYRPTMLVGAFVTAFILGGVSTKLVLYGGSGFVDWALLLFLAAAGGVGATIAAWKISGQLLQTRVNVAELQP